MEKVEKQQEFETRAIYDLVKIDLFEKWKMAGMCLTQFRHNRKISTLLEFKNYTLMLFESMRTHIIKRGAYDPKEFKWLVEAGSIVNPKYDITKTENADDWIIAYYRLSDELMDMGVLNVHDVQDDPNKKLSPKGRG